MRTPAFLWLACWSVLAIPWTSFSADPHWERAIVVPFRYGPRFDDALNFMYFVPLGVFAASRKWSLARATATAALISGLTELTQLFSTSRFPSNQDLLMNVTGAVLGFVVWSRARELADEDVRPRAQR